MKKKILIVQPIHERGVQVFDDRFDVRVASDPSVATVIKEIKGVEGVVVRTAPFTREIIEAADALKVIGRHGVGVDNIDVKAATEKGIVVVNTPNANATSVAEHTLTVIGALAKRVDRLRPGDPRGAMGDPQQLQGRRPRRQDPRPRRDREDRLDGRPAGGGGLQHEGHRLRPLRHAGEGAGNGRHPRARQWTTSSGRRTWFPSTPR